MSTHNLYFRAKKEKIVYTCKPPFYYIKVGCTLHRHVIMMTDLYFCTQNFKAVVSFCGCADWFIHKDRFSHNEAYQYMPHH